MERQEVFTMQRLDRDITISTPMPADIAREYNDYRGAFYELGQYLGTSNFLWCFPEWRDFDNDWMRLPWEREHRI